MIFIAIGILHISVTFFRTTIEIRVLVTFEMFWKRQFKTTAISSFEFPTKTLNGVVCSICITRFTQQLDFLFSKSRLDGDLDKVQAKLNRFRQCVGYWKEKLTLDWLNLIPQKLHLKPFEQLTQTLKNFPARENFLLSIDCKWTFFWQRSVLSSLSLKQHNLNDRRSCTWSNEKLVQCALYYCKKNKDDRSLMQFLLFGTGFYFRWLLFSWHQYHFH